MKTKLWALVASVNLVLVCMLGTLVQLDNIPVITDQALPPLFFAFLAALLMSIVLAIMNISAGIKEGKALAGGGNLSYTLGTIARAKYAILPFFLLHALFWVTVLFMGLLPKMAPLLLVFAISPLCLVYSFLILAGTSVYSGVAIWQLQREGRIDSKQHMRYLMCQVFFVAGTISVAMLLGKLKKPAQNREG